MFFGLYCLSFLWYNYFMISTVCCLIGLHLATAHFDASRTLNDYNPGIYIQVDKVVVGSYLNSVYKQTNYLGYVHSIGHVDVMMGVATGYYKDVIPMVVPSMKFGHLRVAFLPKTVETSSSFLHFTIEKEFK